MSSIQERRASANVLAAHWSLLAPGPEMSAGELQKLFVLRGKHTEEEVRAAMEISAAQYLKFTKEGRTTELSFEYGLQKVSGICRVRQASITDPDLQPMLQLRAQAKRGFRMTSPSRLRELLDVLLAARKKGVSISKLEYLVAASTTWDELLQEVRSAGLVAIEVVRPTFSSPIDKEDDPKSAFVTVPETTFPDGQVEPSFQIGRYLCSKGSEGGAVIDATLAPWVDVAYADARSACAAAGLKLMTERQALALALDIAGQAANWTGGAVGTGALRQGLLLDSIDSAEPGNFVPVNPSENRWFVLSNGQWICDAAGNAYTWIFDDVQGDEQGLVARPFAADSLTTNTGSTLTGSRKYRSFEQPATWEGYALVRGGFFSIGHYVSVFGLGRQWPSVPHDSISFRATK